MMQKMISLNFLTSLLLCFSLFANAQDCLQLELTTANVVQGEQVCLPVKVENFQGIIGFQFSINWEGDQLNYNNLIELNEDIGISLSNFGTPDSGLDEGNLTVSWTSPSLTPVSLSNSEILFSVCLDVVGDGSLVTFGDSPTIIEILDENLEISPVGFLNGKASVSEPIDLIEVEDICAGLLTCQSPTTTLSVEVIGGMPPYTYLWDGPNGYFASDQNPTVNEEGQYKLLVTDAEGYSASAFYNVITDLQDDFISNVVIQNASCATDNGSITLEMVGETDDYSFVWNTGADSNSIEGLSEGDYAVTITDGNTSCAIEETYTVATESFITAFSYECEFLPDTVMATVSSVVWSGGTPPYTFDWSNGNSQLVNMDFPVSSIYVGADGTYSLTITDANGCSEVYTDITADCEVVSDDVSINVSSANVDLGDQVCVDVSVDSFTDIIGIQGTIEWDEALMSFDDVSSTGVLAGIVFGTNDLPDEGKLSYSWVDSDLSSETLANGTVIFEMCFTALAEGTSLVSPSSDPTPIEFIDNANTVIPYNTNFGTVQIGANNQLLGAVSYECETFPDSLAITLSAVAWTGTPPFTFDWSTGETEQSDFLSTIVVNEENVLYGVTITDAAGLTYVENNILPICGSTQPEFTVGLSCEHTVYPDSTVVDLSVMVWAGGTPPYTFEWSNGFTEVNGSISILTYTCPGTYSLTITDSDGNSEVLEDVTDNCDCDNSGVADVELSIDHGVGETGDQVCVSVRAEVFEDIMGIQYSLNYDPDVATLSTIEPKDLPALTIGNFGLLSPGVVTMSWIDPTLSGVSLDAGTALYELCFDIVGDLGTSTAILFGDIPTPIEFTNSASEVVVFQGSHGSITVAENVWPGDSDNSELVTNVDLLNIGLGYGLTGPQRPETGTDWQGYGALDWDQSTPQSNINYKNADANGDGIISALDANAILNNYREETNFWDGEEDQFFDHETTNLTSPPIFVLPDTVVPGVIVEFPIIMGSDAFPADDIYGVAFTILYDPEVVVPESAFASFGDSWVGMIDDDMLGLYMDFHSQGKIDIAITRTDGINVSGNGQIGTLHLTIEDVILRSTLYPVEFEVVDVTVIRNDEEPMIITPKKTTMIIDIVNSVSEIPLDKVISIFPNPTNDHLFINTDEVDILEVAVHAIDGSLMPLDYNHSNALSLKDLPNGVYLLKVYTDKGILSSRIVKQ